jgi:hypothetical protein
VFLLSSPHSPRATKRIAAHAVPGSVALLLVVGSTIAPVLNPQDCPDGRSRVESINGVPIAALQGKQPIDIGYKFIFAMVTNSFANANVAIEARRTLLAH